MSLPIVYDLSYEEVAADNLIAQGCHDGLAMGLATYLSPQYGEAIQATVLLASR